MTIPVSSEMSASSSLFQVLSLCASLLPVSAVQAATEHSSGTCLMVLIFLDRLIEGTRTHRDS